MLDTGDRLSVSKTGRGPVNRAEPSTSGPTSLAFAADFATGYDGTPAVSEVTFELTSGQRLALLGPNGGGKTTLLRAMTGQLRTLAGSLEVNARCGTVPQTDRSRLDYPVSAHQVATMGSLSRLAWWRRPGRAERQRALEALDRVGLGDLHDATFGTLSAGQRQRVLIARGLVQDAGLMLLDEPFAGLDTAGAELLDDLISELAAEGRGVVIATHDLEQARRWDLVLCLNHRQVAFGAPREVLGRAVLEATYGGAIVEIPGDGGLGVLPPHHH